MIAARVPNRGPRPRGQARTAAPSTLDTNTRDQAILCKKFLVLPAKNAGAGPRAAVRTWPEVYMYA